MSNEYQLFKFTDLHYQIFIYLLTYLLTIIIIGEDNGYMGLQEVLSKRLIMTVHAPHPPCPQPSFVPFRHTRHRNVIRHNQNLIQQQYSNSNRTSTGSLTDEYIEA